jgi:hypothetical protein
LDVLAAQHRLRQLMNTADGSRWMLPILSTTKKSGLAPAAKSFWGALEPSQSALMSGGADVARKDLKHPPTAVVGIYDF